MVEMSAGARARAGDKNFPCRSGWDKLRSMELDMYDDLPDTRPAAPSSLSTRKRYVSESELERFLAWSKEVEGDGSGRNRDEQRKR